MEKETIDQLVKDKRLIKASEFKDDGNLFDEYGQYYPLLVHDPEETAYHVTIPYYKEIFKALDLFISNQRDYEEHIYYTQLKNRLNFEPPGAEQKKQFLLTELTILKNKIISNAELGLDLDLKESGYLLLRYFIADHFEEWQTHWIEFGSIDFEHLQGVDVAPFTNALHILVLVECIEIVKLEIEIQQKVQEQTTPNPLPEIGQKLIWQGTPAHLAFVIDLLIEKGYLRKPTPFSERSAELLLNIFDFTAHHPTKESLGKLLHKDKYPINDMTVVDRFKRIPARNELKK